jgi:hypothetical protein
MTDFVQIVLGKYPKLYVVILVLFVCSLSLILRACLLECVN